MMENEKKYMKVRLGDIRLDNYQRNQKANIVNKIVKNFNPMLANPPKVSFRDGQYWAFDGGHTIAARLYLDGVDAMIDCFVFYGLTKEQEAELFEQQNGFATPVSVGEKFRSKIIRKDEDALEIKRICEKNGFYIKTKGSLKDKVNNAIMSVAALTTQYNKLGPEGLDDMLYILHHAWHGDPDSVRSPMLNGLGKFISVYNGRFSRERMIKKIERKRPLDFINAVNTSLGRHDAVAYARLFLAVYNGQSRPDNCLPDLL